MENRSAVVDPAAAGIAAARPERDVVRKATPADVPILAQAMARAFHDDPVVGPWCMPHEARRLRRLERTFELFLRAVYLPHDQCYTTEGLVGGAFWLPPDTWEVRGSEQLRLVARLTRIHGRAVARILQVMAFIEAKHPHEPHYYLQFVGVDPRSQGRGVGSALLQPVLERCDRDGMPAYLEATSERNRALYERHGFAVVEEIRLPAGGPPMWGMWRRAPASSSLARR
jgi:ribosomal protein S18 acetylase RimI-like enzyme